ncbi:Microtubule-associated protein, microtubule dynamics during spindle orientation, partial [Ceratobasidium sp. 392]
MTQTRGNSSTRTDPEPTARSNLAMYGHRDNVEAAEAPTTQEDITKVISNILSNDLERSIRALITIQNVLKVPPDQALLSQSFQDLSGHIEGLVETVSIQMGETFELSQDDVNNAATYRLMKHLIQTCNAICDHPMVVKSLSVDSLQALLEELTTRSLQTDDTRDQKVKDLSRFLNMVILRLFSTGQRISVLHALFNLLLQLTKPFPTSGTTTDAREAKLAELMIKCIWKLAKEIPDDLQKELVDPTKLLVVLETFFQAIPPQDWRQRSVNKVPCGDMPLRTIKVIIQHIVGHYASETLLNSAEKKLVFESSRSESGTNGLTQSTSLEQLSNRPPQTISLFSSTSTLSSQVTPTTSASPGPRSNHRSSVMSSSGQSLSLNEGGTAFQGSEIEGDESNSATTIPLNRPETFRTQHESVSPVGNGVLATNGTTNSTSEPLRISEPPPAPPDAATVAPNELIPGGENPMEVAIAPVQPVHPTRELQHNDASSLASLNTQFSALLYNSDRLSGQSAEVPPPQWMRDCLAATQMRYPHDRMDAIIKLRSQDVRESPTPELRLKCLDCPGKLYMPGPEQTLTNFEIHLEDRIHRSKVDQRIAAEAAAGAPLTTLASLHGTSSNEPQNQDPFTSHKTMLQPTTDNSSPAEVPSSAPENTVLISRVMPASEVIAHLGNHGCNDITDQLDLASSSSYPIFNGGFGDVYKVNLRDGTQVAVKTMRVQINSTSEGAKHLKNAARELHTWAKCDHPNVLKLLGLARFRDQIGMVSMWMDHGSLPSYLQLKPTADRCHIVHGDLKGLNVLISSSGAPMLADFGSAVLKDRTLQFTATTKATSISFRWAAPELFEQSCIHSMEADVYALGMTILETITGNVPYYGKGEPAVMFAVVLRGEPPARPEDDIPSDSEQGNELWALLLSCWSKQPNERPHAGKVADSQPDGVQMKTIQSSGLLRMLHTRGSSLRQTDSDLLARVELVTNSHRADHDNATTTEAPVTQDDITKVISNILSNDPKQSVNALKVIQNVLEVPSDQAPLSPSFRDLADHTEGLVETIVIQMGQTFERSDDVNNAATYRVTKHLIQTCNAICDHAVLLESLSVDSLQSLLEELTTRLLQIDDTRDQKVKDLSRFLNMVILRLFNTGRKISVLRALFNLLLQLTKPFPANGTTADAREAKVAELVLKCVWKLARNIPNDLQKGLIDPIELLPTLETFLQTIPPKDWRQRSANKVPCGDMPLRTIKVIIQYIVAHYAEQV